MDQDGVPTRSWKQSAWATQDGPTMYSQERQQNDSQISNVRRKLEFHNMQISDSGYLEKVFKNMKKKMNLAEDAPSLGIQAHKRKDLVNVYVDNNEGSDPYGTRLY